MRIPLVLTFVLPSHVAVFAFVLSLRGFPLADSAGMLPQKPVWSDGDCLGPHESNLAVHADGLGLAPQGLAPGYQSFHGEVDTSLCNAIDFICSGGAPCKILVPGLVAGFACVASG